MIAVALLMPVSMLCLVLALGSYEERLLTPGGARKARRAGRRRLRAVPHATTDGTDAGSRVREKPTAQRAGDTRAAAGTAPEGSGSRWRAA